MSRIERDSVSPEGVRVTTVVWTIPRVVLAECHTHRTMNDGAEIEIVERQFPPGFSKNTSSSRAIPVPKMLEMVENTPYIPEFGLNQKGMQSDLPLDQDKTKVARDLWIIARNTCVDVTRSLHALNVHKQDANRLLEPFGWVTQVLTADQYSWSNFFALRCHSAAHPAIRKAARKLYLQYRASKPKALDYGEWHLPFVDPKIEFSWTWLNFSGGANALPELLKFSVARCAWVSYDAHDGDGSREKIDRTLHALVSADPLHASPAEHQWTPATEELLVSVPRLKSNLAGGVQLRKLLPREAARSYEPSESEIATWEDAAT